MTLFRKKAWALFCVFWAAAGALSAASYTWSGSVSSDWFNSLNWTPNGNPTAGDTVTFNSGTINFTNFITFSGQFNWNGGTLAGYPLTVASGSTMTVANNYHYLWTTLTNLGTVTWPGGTIEADYNSGYVEYGTIVNGAGALWDIQNSLTLNNGYPNGAVFQNAGTVRRSVNTGTATISLPFVNSGLVTNAAGVLAFANGGTLEGAFSALAGTSINFNAGQFAYNTPPVVNGPGTVQVNGSARLTLANNIITNLQLTGGTITLGPNFEGGVITNLTITGGTLNGNNTVTGVFTNGAALPGSVTVMPGASMNWTAGSIQAPVSISAGASLTISGGATKYLWAPLTNAGTVAWMDPGTIEVDYVSGSGQFGSIQNLSGALWDIESSSGGQLLDNTGPNGAYFQNVGTLRKTTGPTTTISVPFYNTGLVTNISGTLLFNNGGTLGGTVGAAAGAFINFNSGFYAIASPLSITGTGTVQMTGGTVTLASNIVPNLQLAGATVQLGPSFQGGMVSNLTLLGGTLSNSVTVSGTFNTGASVLGGVTLLPGATANWSAGSISGPVTVAAGAALTVSGGVTKPVGTMTNYGTVIWTGTAQLEVDYSTVSAQFGSILNEPGALFDISNSVRMTSSGGTVANFQNFGSFRKSADTGNTTINVPFLNSGSGTVTILQGTLTFNDGGVLSGTYYPNTGATLNLAGGAFMISGAPAIVGTGLAEITGGTLTLSNNIIPNFQLAGGTVTLGPNFQGGVITNLTVTGGILPGNNIVSGTLTVGGGYFIGGLTLLPGATLNWSGGTLQGPVNIPQGATVNISGDNTTKYLWGPLTNAGVVTWAGAGGIETDNSSVNSEYALIQNLSGATWTISGSAGLVNQASGTGAYFQNAGLLQKLADTGTTTISIPLVNTGTLTCSQGAINFRAGGTLGGAISAGARAIINFSLGALTYTVPPTVSGTGTVEMTGGSLTLANNPFPNFQLAGGTLTLGPNFEGGMITNLTMTGGTILGNNTVSGVFNFGASLPGSLTLLPGANVNWSGGAVQGPVSVPAGASLTLGGTGLKALWGPLTNSGLVTWTDGNMEVDNSSPNNQSGLIVNMPGATWDIQNDQTIYNTASTNSAFIRNAGTFQKSLGGGTTTIYIPFTNNATLSPLQATLSFSSVLTLSPAGTLIDGLGSANNYGNINVSGAATLAGTMNVVFTAGFEPAKNASFNLVTYGSHSGSFAPFNLPPAATWQTTYGSTALNITVSDINKLVLTTSPNSTVAGSILTPIVVQVADSVSGSNVATNGLPITASISSGTGLLSGTTTLNTDVNGKVSFNDLSINLVGVKYLTFSAPGATPVTATSISINPAAPAQLAITTPIGPKQVDGGAFQPSPVVQVEDAFGNFVSGAVATLTARSTSSGTGALSGSTNASTTTGVATFTNLYYNLGNRVVSETPTVYFTSPGLTPATNAPTFVNFVFGRITLQDHNSIIQIDPTSPEGMYSWTVDGAQQLYQQWYWVGLTATNQISVDTLAQPLGVALSPSTATFAYVASPVTTQIGYTLHGGANGSGSSDLTQTITVQNTSANPATLRFYQYADFDFSPADSLIFSTPTNAAQSGGTSIMTQTITSGSPNFWEGSFYALTLDRLLANTPAALSDSIIPPAAGDQTFAYQWNATLNSNQTLTVNLTQSIRPVAGDGAIQSQIALLPMLNIAADGANVIISWTTNGTQNLQLRSCDTVEGSWSVVTNTPSTVGAEYQVTLPRTENASYYRLQP